MIEQIIADIKRERARQENLWGHKFDDKNTISEWTAVINEYACKSASINTLKINQRDQLVKAAAVCIAAIEAHDRNGGFPDRHFDAPISSYAQNEASS